MNATKAIKQLCLFSLLFAMVGLSTGCGLAVSGGARLYREIRRDQERERKIDEPFQFAERFLEAQNRVGPLAGKLNDEPFKEGSLIKANQGKPRRVAAALKNVSGLSPEQQQRLDQEVKDFVASERNACAVLCQHLEGRMQELQGNQDLVARAQLLELERCYQYFSRAFHFLEKNPEAYAMGLANPYAALSDADLSLSQNAVAYRPR